MTQLKSASTTRPRVLLASSYNTFRRAYNTISYEFCRVIAEIEDADILAPDIEILTPEATEARDILSKMRRVAGLSRLPSVRRTEIEKNYDLFFYICAFPRSLAEISRFAGWRRRCRKGAAFLLESWSSGLRREGSHLRLLDDFDHVFVLNRDSIPNVQRHTKTPCTFLSIGIDSLAATPYPDPPVRTLDVYSMGRRSETTHQRLFDMAARGEIFYMYDTFPAGEPTVPDWPQHRFLISSLIKRSRYFIMYSYAGGGGYKEKEAAGEHALPFRLFQGAAGGAVMIGSAPQCSEFKEFFGWPDAVIEAPADPNDLADFLKHWDGATERVARLRRMNATQSLRRHDWVYRWEEALQHLGLEPKPQLGRRKELLKGVADEAEAAAMPAASA